MSAIRLTSRNIIVAALRGARRMSQKSLQRLIYAQAIVAAPLFWLALRVCGPARTISFAHGRRTRQAVGPSSKQTAHVLAGQVNAAVTRTLGPNQCLTRSLVLAWLLARRGIVSALRVGVRREGPALLAHAWVEVDGTPINDSPQVVGLYAAFDDILPLTAFGAQGKR